MSNGSAPTRCAYEAWHRGLEIDPEARTPWYEMIKRHVCPARDLAGRLILEIGCGRGDFSCWLAKQGERPARVVAADFALTALAKGARYAKGANLSSLAWQAADVQSIPFTDSSFDTVFSCETIEHVPRPFVALVELARVLKPGGRLFLTTPNYLNVWALYRGYLRLTGRCFSEAGQPLNKMMLLPRELWRVRRVGLQVQVVDGVCHYLPRGPGKPAFELGVPENLRFLSRWVASQTLIVAEKAAE